MGSWWGARGSSIPASTRTAPTLTLFTANLTYPPQLDVGLDDTAAVGDTIYLYHRSKAGALLNTFSNTIDAGEAAANAATFTGLSGIVSGTNRFTAAVQASGEAASALSNQIIQGPDDVEPVLTLPIDTTLAATTASLGVTTDTAEGTLYYVVTTSATPPSKAQVKLGQNQLGAAAAYAGSQAITTTGAKTATASGLTASTAYYGYFMHEDVAANQSDVAAGNGFTTDAVAPFSMTEVAAPATQNIGFATNVITFSGQSLGAADSSRKILIGLFCRNDATGVTVAGIAATQVGAMQNFKFSTWVADVPTGTTGDIVVTSSTNVGFCGIRVTRVVGSAGAPTVDTLVWGFNTSPQQLAVTTPAGGGTAIYGDFDTTSGTAAWTNATGQSQAQVGETLASAIRTTAGAATVSVTGFGSVSSSLRAVSYGP